MSPDGRRCLLAFGLDFIEQIDELTQRVEALLKRLSCRANVQSRHSRSLVETETLADHLFRPDQISFEHQIIGDQCDGSFALPLQPEILDAQSQIRISSTLEDLVIEIV